jgi:hypothetical protein
MQEFEQWYTRARITAVLKRLHNVDDEFSPTMQMGDVKFAKRDLINGLQQELGTKKGTDEAKNCLQCVDTDNSGFVTIKEAYVWFFKRNIIHPNVPAHTGAATEHKSSSTEPTRFDSSTSSCNVDKRLVGSALCATTFACDDAILNALSRPDPRKNFFRANVISGEHVLFTLSDFSGKPDGYATSGKTSKPKLIFPFDAQPRYSSWCPFCVGNEHLCMSASLVLQESVCLKPELSVPSAIPSPEKPAHSSAEQKRDSTAWLLRVVPNKFPCLQFRLGPITHGFDGLRLQIPAIGRHDVIIETPFHNEWIAQAPPALTERLLRAFVIKGKEWSLDSRMSHIVYYKNHGPLSGGSLPHGHSQMVAVPFVPSFVLSRLDRARAHFVEHGRCLMCQLFDEEMKTELEESRVLVITECVVIICYSYIPFCIGISFCLFHLLLHQHITCGLFRASTLTISVSSLTNN